MNMENIIVDYRHEVLKIDTRSNLEIKNDMDIYSKGLKKLFMNLNVDYLILKENQRRNGNWNFPDNKKEEIYKLFLQISQKNSIVNSIICGKSSMCDVNDLQDIVELILDLFRENGESTEIIENKRKIMYRALDLPLLELKKEIKNFETVLDTTYNNQEDEFTLDLHMMYQRYIADKIRQLKREAAMLYCAVNNEISMTKSKNEVSIIKEQLNLTHIHDKIDGINKILREEYPNVNIFDEEMMRRYNDRRQELLGFEENDVYVKYKKYLIQQSKIQKLCKESKEYGDKIDEINKVLNKKTGDQTKVKNYIKLKDELKEIEKKILDSMGEEIIKNPISITNKEINYSNIFNENREFVSQMLSEKTEDEICDKVLYALAENLFGTL